MMRAAPILVLMSALVGCKSDQGLGKYDGTDGGFGPVIEVTPRELEFGALTAGEVSTQTFNVANIGPEGTVLDVSDIRLMGPAGGYSIVSGTTSFSLAPEDPAQQIVVAFTPMGANAQLSQALVDSNDENYPHVSVDLSGEGLVPELQIDPDPLDMGTTYVGCTNPNVVTLTNIGTDLLSISDLQHAGPTSIFGFTNPNPLPINLDPGASVQVNLTFTPAADETYPTQLIATSNEPLGVRTSEQSGAGLYAGVYADAFDVPFDPPVDLLFYVDQSGSMDDDQSSLAINFASFIYQLSTFTTDWQVIVTTDDDGCNSTGVLTPATPNYETQFTRAVSMGGGQWTEAGLTVSSNALEETDGGECNAGFMRAGALTHVILVSDEPEQSARTWDFYVNKMIAKKGDASLLKISAIAGPVPGGCSSGSNSAEPGTGYVDAVNYTGGEFLSICSSWADSVEALANASVSRSNYGLTHTPVEGTIVVTVNGAEVTNWHYDAATNSVVFDSAPPEGGDHVDIDYAGLATCD